MITDTRVKEIIRKWYLALKFDTVYDIEFERALEEVYVDPSAVAENYNKDDADGRKNFLYYLYFCEALQAAYREKGISDEIFWDNLGDLKAWFDVWSKLKGELYLGEVPWLWYTFTLRIIKLGRLQFKPMVLQDDVSEAGLKSGDCVLDIHIPARGALTTDECLASLDFARKFFSEYYPDFDYKCFVCYSWLLDTGLSDLLGEGSNILGFQRLFNVVKLKPATSTLDFVLRWRIDRTTVKDFECKTSLQHKVKAAYLSGRQFMLGYGVIRK